jgi:hypothetical protein
MRRRRLETRKKTRRPGGPQIAFWLAALTAALATGSALGEELPQLTTRQMTALPPDQADRIIRQDLLSVLQPVGGLHQGAGRFLRYVDLTTPAFNTEYADLCRRDVLRLRYAPVNNDGPYPDRPLRPHGIEAHAQFALRHALPLDWRRLEPDKVLGGDCERMGGDATVHWFDAPSDLNAGQAVNLFDAALTGVTAGKLTPCPSNNANCGELSSIRRVKVQDLYRIRPCGAEGSGMVCYEYDLRPATTVQVVAPQFGVADHLSPDDIVSVREFVLIDDE